jgi:phosphate/sulfate permease
VTENNGKIKWKTLRRIFIGWVATIPVSAIIAASVYILLITL